MCAVTRDFPTLHFTDYDYLGRHNSVMGSFIDVGIVYGFLGLSDQSVGLFYTGCFHQRRTP